eukprot:1178299-Pleurochrysis_carterae.AAC.2
MLSTHPARSGYLYPPREPSRRYPRYYHHRTHARARRTRTADVLAATTSAALRRASAWSAEAVALGRAAVHAELRAAAAAAEDQDDAGADDDAVVAAALASAASYFELRR